MIERYTPAQIGKIWTDDEKFRRFLKIEVFLCQALARAGKIPKEASGAFSKVKISTQKIKNGITTRE